MWVRGTFKTVFDDIWAELVKWKLYDILDDGVNNLYFFYLETILEDVRNHIIAILLWR